MLKNRKVFGFKHRFPNRYVLDTLVGSSAAAMVREDKVEFSTTSSLRNMNLDKPAPKMTQSQKLVHAQQMKVERRKKELQRLGVKPRHRSPGRPAFEESGLSWHGNA